MPSEMDRYVSQVIRQYPIPSKNEQVVLGRRIRAWQDWDGGPEAAPKAVRRSGERALNRMVTGNLRLAVVAAHRAARMRVPGAGGSDVEEMLQSASLGLVAAARKFNPKLGYSFATYAQWWIRMMMQQESRRQYSIRLPENVACLASRAHAAMMKLQTEMGRTPTVEEVAGSMSGKDVSQESVAWAMKASAQAQTVMTLNRRVLGGEGQSELIDMVSDKNVDEQMWSEVYQDEIQERVRGALATLPPDVKGIMFRHMLNGQSRSAIAKDLNLKLDEVIRRIRRGKHHLRSCLQDLRAHLA